MKEIKLEYIKKNSDVIRVPRLYAQANITIPKESKIEIIDKNGNRFYRSNITINDEKIIDSCFYLFQNSNVAKTYQYDNLRREAIESLSSRFEKYNVNELPEDTSKTKEEKLYKREVAIAQWIREHIEKNLTLVFNADFDDFMNNTGIKSANRLNNALELLNRIQSKVFYEYSVDVISDDFSTIKNRITKVSAIPKISIDIDKSLGEINSIQEFIDLKINNKRKYILGLVVTVSSSYLSAVLGLGRDYTPVHKFERDKFKKCYAHRIDTLIKSIRNVQNSKKNYFTIQEFQKKIGTNYEEYKHLKRVVLMPSLGDICKNTSFHVELIEHKKTKGKVVAISFKITAKKDKNKRFGIDIVAYYIATQMTHFGKTHNIRDFFAYAKHLEHEIYNCLDFSLYDNKTLKDWKLEAKNAYAIETEILDFIQNNEKLFKSKGIYYSEEKMCLLKKEIVFDKLESENSYRISKEKIVNIKTPNYNVINPLTSFMYIDDVLKKEVYAPQTIMNFLPLYIRKTNGNVLISTPEDYIKHKDIINYHLAKSNLDFFFFPKETDDNIVQLFMSNVASGTLSEINNELRSMINKIYENQILNYVNHNLSEIDED